MIKLQAVLSIFLFSISSLFALEFSTTTNVDAAVEFSAGGNSTTESFIAGEMKSVDLDWLTSTTDVTITTTSENDDYIDTAFTETIEVNSSFGEWESKAYSAGAEVSYNGKDWTNTYYADVGQKPGEHPAWVLISDDDKFVMVIDLERVPYSTDTAYIPISANKDFTLTATPLNSIDGVSGSLEFSFKAHEKDTLMLPVMVDGSPIQFNRVATMQGVSMSKIDGKINLSLPSSFQKSKLSVFSLKGRRILKTSLNSPTKNSSAVWNVSAGIYVMSLKSQSGESFTKKISHTGGDLRISASFNSFSSATTSTANSSRRAREATKAQYRFDLNVDDSKFNDSTSDYEFSGELEDEIEYYFINPNSMASFFGQLMDSSKYEEFFPNRFGYGYGDYTDGREIPENEDDIYKLTSDGDYDFYTYESLINAIDNMAEIEVDLYVGVNSAGVIANGCSRLVWKNKRTDETNEFRTQEKYDETVENGSEIFVGTVDYAKFCNEGDLATRKQELSAFLGNISHETTAAAHSVTPKIWGLYWREEAAWQKGGGGLGYVDEFPNSLYPPSSGQSYHGRGPIQITHNVNYGQLSEFLYGDKQVLLDNPGKLVPDGTEDATTAFMSAIWFWMTPQAPKPSCHDVMVNNWVPDADDIAANRDDSKFGVTVNIINGGLECGLPGDSRVNDRIEYYQRYIELLGEEPESKCDCGNMGSSF
jgi:hypothetical protein